MAQISPDALMPKAQNKNKFFDGNMLVFRVGPDLETFHVHAQIILPQSEFFDKLTTGHFEENVGEAKLDVKPEIFTKFLTYAYSSSLRPYEQNDTKHAHTQKICISKLIELLLKQQHKVFACKCCRGLREIQFAKDFPLCQTCASEEISINWSAACIMKNCSREGEYIQGLLCSECMTNLGLLHHYGGGKREEALSNLRYAKPVRLEDIKEFRFDIPSRASEILAMAENSNQRLLPMSNDILATARLAIFADKYICRELLQETLRELYRQLAHANLDEENVDVISAVARLVYESTGNETADEQVPEHKILRSMLSQFIAFHRQQFLASLTFRELLSEGGDLAFEVLTAIP